MAHFEPINAEKIIKIGQCLSIIMDGKEGGIVTYSSRIEDIENNVLVLAMPMDKGYPILPEIGSMITGKIFDSGAFFQFDTIYIGKKADPIPVWLVKMPEQVKRYQQREFVRVNVLIRASVQCEEEDELENLLPAEPANIRNLSGGGAQIALDRQLDINSKLYLSFQLPDIGMIRVYSEVVRADEMVRNHYVFAVRFLNLSEKTRVQLIRYIFDCQRKLLRVKR